jgi:SSS family solute:Na+ symporter
MAVRLGILLVYLLITLIIGLVFRKKAMTNRVEFFLAGRKLSKPLLFFTLAATNFSAFTIFGLSGAGYRIGYAFYPVMGFGTGFMALSFYLIGSKILILSKKRNYITPSDYIADRYNSPLLKKLFSLIMILFTLPYIAIQTVASGKSLHALIGLPYLTGAMLISAFIILYVVLGGMHSIAWTDLIQGLMLVLFTLAAFLIISGKIGGFTAVHREISSQYPSLLSRPGLDGSMTIGVWVSYLVLWFFADPMFPQLFQRFMAARNEKALNASIVFYPIITTFLFFLTVSIGVMGRLVFPDLPASQSDTIFPLLLQKYTGVFLSTLLLTGSIAALMSTMDSQLLTLTSIVTVDFMKPKKPGVFWEKLTIVVIGILGFLLAVKPPQTILGFINKTTFNGLSVLAPTVIGGLYWKRANRYAAIASILTGQALVVCFYCGWLRVTGMLPVIPILLVTIAVFIVVSLFTHAGGENLEIVFPIDRRFRKWAPVFLVLFLLGIDFWAWNRTPVLIAGLPLWVWYYIALGVLLSLAFRLFLSDSSIKSQGNRRAASQ